MLTSVFFWIWFAMTMASILLFFFTFLVQAIEQLTPNVIFGISLVFIIYFVWFAQSTYLAEGTMLGDMQFWSFIGPLITMSASLIRKNRELNEEHPAASKHFVKRFR